MALLKLYDYTDKNGNLKVFKFHCGIIKIIDKTRTQENYHIFTFHYGIIKMLVACFDSILLIFIYIPLWYY